MKASKKVLSVLLSVLLIALTLSCLSVCCTAGAAYAVGDVVEFGAYPQTQADETPALAAAAESAAWKSYSYYSMPEGGTIDNGDMTAGDWMQYADFVCDAVKYRAVKFTAYRPSATMMRQGLAGNSWQDNAGYAENTTYYFKYEPLQWRILDPATGLVLCDQCIDAQPYQNLVRNSVDGKFYIGDSYTYASDYEKSSIRAWLNEDFYNTAFTDAQKQSIQAAALNNDAYQQHPYMNLNSKPTTDKIFLLSYTQAGDSAYGFAEKADRVAVCTDYAKCQGIIMYSGTDASFRWWLRSPGSFCGDACIVELDGSLSGGGRVYATGGGVRPACVAPGLTEEAPGTPDAPTPDNPSQENTSVCPWCGGQHGGGFEQVIAWIHSLLARIFGARY